MVDMFIPEQRFDKASHDSYYSNSKVGTLDVLGATLDETLYYNPGAAANRFLDQYLGPGRTGKRLTPDEWRESEFYREGIEVDDAGITEGLAGLLAERKDRRDEFNNVLSRSKGGFGLMAAQFGVGLAGSFLDPLNVASAFIPGAILSKVGLNQARMATASARLGKNGSRLAMGAVDGAAGAAIVEPIIAGQAYLEQDQDYGLMDSFLNVTFGGILGGGIHFGIGKISDRIEASRAKEEALIRSVAQATADQPIRVGQLIEQTERNSLEETIQRANERIATERQDVAAVERTVDPDTGEIKSEQVTARVEAVPETPQVRRKGNARPPILRAEEPRSLLGFIHDMGGIWTGEKMISELKQAVGAKYKYVTNASQAAKTQVRGKKKITEKVRPGGKTLDHMLTLAREEGYLPPAIDGVPDDVGINELLKLIELEADGIKQYSDADIGKVQAFDDAQELGAAAQKFGIDTKGLDDETFMRALQEASENQDFYDYNSVGPYGDVEDANTTPIDNGDGLTEAEAFKLQQESMASDYNLGNDADMKPVLNQMDKEGTTPPEIDPVVLAKENELLEGDVTRLQEQNVIPQDLMDAIEDADSLVEKADTVYDEMVRAGATCMNNRIP